jgi:thiamine pyrophosphate-dependent acetolactate synthase large subunit-like protein
LGWDRWRVQRPETPEDKIQLIQARHEEMAAFMASATPIFSDELP